jgi:hypothetical protein
MMDGAFRVETLLLHGTRIGIQGLNALADASKLPTNSIRVLGMSGNAFQEENMRRLASALQINQRLKELILMYCSITPTLFKTMMKDGIANDVGLRSLRLGFNFFSPSYLATETIIHTMSANQNIKVLSISQADSTLKSSFLGDRFCTSIITN